MENIGKKENLSLMGHNLRQDELGHAEEDYLENLSLTGHTEGKRNRKDIMKKDDLENVSPIGHTKHKGNGVAIGRKMA